VSSACPGRDRRYRRWQHRGDDHELPVAAGSGGPAARGTRRRAGRTARRRPSRRARCRRPAWRPTRRRRRGSPLPQCYLDRELPRPLDRPRPTRMISDATEPSSPRPKPDEEQDVEGEIEAIPLRGAWTGNRGILHSNRPRPSPPSAPATRSRSTTPRVTLPPDPPEGCWPCRWGTEVVGRRMLEVAHHWVQRRRVRCRGGGRRRWRGRCRPPGRRAPR
jgi:hypothetical protein